MQTLRTIPNNKPFIVIRENKKRTCTLKHVAISGDRSVIKTEAEKIFKNKGPTTEIQRIWNVTTKLVPETTGATGSISKYFRKYLSNIEGKHEIKELQKTAIIDIAHILWKVLM